MSSLHCVLRVPHISFHATRSMHVRRFGVPALSKFSGGAETFTPKVPEPEIAKRFTGEATGVHTIGDCWLMMRQVVEQLLLEQGLVSV